MTVSPEPSPLSRRSRAYWLASMSWYSSTLTSGQLVRNAEIGGQTRSGGMLPEDHQAKSVEGGDRQPGGLRGDQPLEPLAHLAGRPAGEREGEAGLRCHAAFGYLRGDAVGERARLARARTRDDHQGPGRLRGCPLIRVEPV